MNNEKEIKIETITYPDKKPTIQIGNINYPPIVETNTPFIIEWTIHYVVDSDKTTTITSTLKDETGILVEKKQTVPDFIIRFIAYVLSWFGYKNLRTKGKTSFRYYSKGITKKTTYTLEAGYY